MIHHEKENIKVLRNDMMDLCTRTLGDRSQSGRQKLEIIAPSEGAIDELRIDGKNARRRLNASLTMFNIANNLSRKRTMNNFCSVRLASQ